MQPITSYTNQNKQKPNDPVNNYVTAKGVPGPHQISAHSSFNHEDEPSSWQLIIGWHPVAPHLTDEWQARELRRFVLCSYSSSVSRTGREVLTFLQCCFQLREFSITGVNSQALTLYIKLFLPARATVWVGNLEPKRPFFPSGHILHLLVKARNGRRQEPPLKCPRVSLLSPALCIHSGKTFCSFLSIHLFLIFSSSLFSHLFTSPQKGFKYGFKK